MDDGLGVVFDRAIDAFVERHLRAVLEQGLSVLGLRRDRIDRIVCHPGGARVLQAIERSLDLPDGALAEERGVLRDYGNMSSPTVLFVLE